MRATMRSTRAALATAFATVVVEGLSSNSLRTGGAGAGDDALVGAATATRAEGGVETSPC